MAAASAAMGRPFMPHQRQVVDVWLEVQSEAAGDPEPGEWAYDDGSLTIQRRGGKTSIISPVAAHRARLVRAARMFMTAHNGGKARKRWMDVTDDLLSSPLRHDVRRKVSIAHEELRWLDGGSLLVPFAPNEDGLHSETPDLVFVDELWAFSAEQRREIEAGYVPAFATSSGQAFKMSTAGTERSDWLNAVRRAGRASVDAGVTLGSCYHEWSIPTTIGTRPLSVLSDAEVIELCVEHHPAVCHVPGCPGPAQKRPCPHGFTVRPAAIRSAWATMDDRSEFIRAYGNVTQDDTSGAWRAVSEATFVGSLETAGIPADAPVALGVWVDHDGEDAAVVSSWRDRSGFMHVEVIDRRVGTTWVAPYVAGVCGRQTVTAIGVPNVGASRDVADQLRAGGLKQLLPIAQADVAAACSRHRDALLAGAWKQMPHDAATPAAKAVDWRKAGGGYVWWRDGEPISAFAAQTTAGWAYDHPPEQEHDPGEFRIM